ncbi:DEAD/DEAH box helicase family protein [Lysinibacillus sphaericus]|uniref:DEAD/DEAH box helicase n=1 Tax=Lysinibacillus sphaericus TaxID=1421 RepID=UPI002FBE94B5
MSIFQEVKANIHGNLKLYTAQIDAYKAVFSHYNEFEKKPKKDTLIVMPTGSGKTGVMSILPFKVSKGRVLIITPSIIVSETVFSQLDSINNPQETFWYKNNVIKDRKSLPVSYHYRGYNPEDLEEKSRMLTKLHHADFIITNVHKLGNSNPEINLMSLLPPDFFDMILIDEAHHVAADMWQKAISYFKPTKIIKLTATPFRGDKQSIIETDFDLIYEYTLGEAIKDGLVKNIVKHEDIPGSMEFYNLKTNEKYSLEQAKRRMGNSWVNKSIALSETCSRSVIQATKKTLLEKRQSFPHHQVLAVTCNDEHARQVADWFNKEGLKATYISTRSIERSEINRRLADYAQGKYDVMVSIQLLSEGYDNPNISVISLFRPFKTLTPYSQAIGRGLRKIYAPDLHPVDNYCNVIYHQELGLEKLWQYYKEQETYADVLRKQQEFLTEQLIFEFDELGFVEKAPSNLSNKANLEENDYVINTHEGTVSTYESLGLGKNDSFIDGGIEEYHKALRELNSTKLNEYQNEVDNINSMLQNGLINEEEAALLIESKEKKFQSNITENVNQFYEIFYSETLRTEFNRWLNTRIEGFFKESLLEKESFEIYEFSRSLDTQPINNIGYIVKNIRQSLRNTIKKSITNYDSIDFATAKEIVINKLKFWLDQHGRKEE